MSGHIYWDESTKHGAMIRQMLAANESGDDQMADVREMIIAMREGDGSQDVHYDNVVKRCKVGGYDPTQGDPTTAQRQMARSLFEELDSAFSKTSGNGSVDNVRAARDQLYAKTR